MVRLKKKGLALRKIAQEVKARHGLTVSYMTVRRVLANDLAKRHRSR